MTSTKPPRTNTTTTTTYEIRDDDGKIFNYTEYLNDKGKVIDETLSDIDGNEITDEELLSKARDFVDNILG